MELNLKEILDQLSSKACAHKDERTIESVRNNLIKAISSDVRISGRHNQEDGIILMMSNLAKSQDFKEAIEGIAQIILLMFPVELEEEKPQE